MKLYPNMSSFTGEDFNSSAAPPVLVVDDDLDGAHATETILTGGGFRVVLEANGDSVLKLVRSSVLQLVVSELYVACSEGSCVVTALKAERHRVPRLRILVHTRHTSPADVEWALTAGGDGVVPKPARKGLLLREAIRLCGSEHSSS